MIIDDLSSIIIIISIYSLCLSAPRAAKQTKNIIVNNNKTIKVKAVPGQNSQVVYATKFNDRRCSSSQTIEWDKTLTNVDDKWPNTPKIPIS